MGQGTSMEMTVSKKALIRRKHENQPETEAKNNPPRDELLGAEISGNWISRGERALDDVQGKREHPKKKRRKGKNFGNSRHYDQKERSETQQDIPDNGGEHPKQARGTEPRDGRKRQFSSRSFFESLRGRGNIKEDEKEKILGNQRARKISQTNLVPNSVQRLGKGHAVPESGLGLSRET